MTLTSTSRLLLARPDEDTAQRLDVRVVAPRRHPHVLPVHQLVIGGVDADPAELRVPDLHPGMARSRAPDVLALVVAHGVVHVAAHVAAGHASRAQHAEHRVREVLAHAAPGLEEHLGTGVDVRRVGVVAEARLEDGAQLAQRQQEVVRLERERDAVFDLLVLDERRDGGGPVQELGEALLPRPLVRRRAGPTGNGVGRLDHGLRPDDELVVRLEQVEVVDVAPEVVVVARQAGARLDLELVRDHPLQAGIDGRLADLAVGLDDGLRIREPGGVRNQDERLVACVPGLHCGTSPAPGAAVMGADAGRSVVK